MDPRSTSPDPNHTLHDLDAPAAWVSIAGSIWAVGGLYVFSGRIDASLNVRAAILVAVVVTAAGMGFAVATRGVRMRWQVAISIYSLACAGGVLTHAFSPGWRSAALATGVVAGPLLAGIATLAGRSFARSTGIALFGVGVLAGLFGSVASIFGFGLLAFPYAFLALRGGMTIRRAVSAA